MENPESILISLAFAIGLIVFLIGLIKSVFAWIKGKLFRELMGFISLSMIGVGGGIMTIIKFFL